MKINFKQIIPWIGLALVLIGAGVWYILSQRVTEEETNIYDQKLSEANTLYQSKEYSTAMTRYYEAVEVIPSRIDAFEGIVAILLEKGRIDDAKDIIDESGGKLSNNDQAILYVSVADAYFSEGDYEQSETTLNVALSIGVDNPEGQLLLGKTYLKLGDVDNSKKQFEKDIYTDELLSEDKLLLSYVYSLSDVENAKTILASVTPTDKWKPYFDEFKSVLDSLNTDTKYNATKQARVYINSGYPYLAISILEPMSSDIEEYLEGMYFLGRAYFDYKNYDKAIEYLDKALSLGGLEEDIFWTEARAYLMKNDLDTSMNDYAKAIAYAGEEVSEALVSEYLDVLLDNNQTIKADQLVQELLSYVDAQYLNLYGVKVNYALTNSEKVDYYLSELGKATLPDSQKIEYLYWKAKVTLERGTDISGVQSIIDEMLNINRYSASAYMLLGQLQFEQGNIDDAKNSLKRALEYDMDGSISESATKLLSRID